MESGCLDKNDYDEWLLLARDWFLANQLEHYYPGYDAIYKIISHAPVSLFYNEYTHNPIRPDLRTYIKCSSSGLTRTTFFVPRTSITTELEELTVVYFLLCNLLVRCRPKWRLKKRLLLHSPHNFSLFLLGSLSQ